MPQNPGLLKHYILILYNIVMIQYEISALSVIVWFTIRLAGLV